MSDRHTLFFGNASVYSLLVAVLKHDGAREASLVGATIKASLIAVRDNALLVSLATQANVAPADFATALVDIVLPVGASGTDSTTFTGRDGEFARLELSIDIAGRKTAYDVPASIQLRQGRS